MILLKLDIIVLSRKMIVEILRSTIKYMINALTQPLVDMEVGDNVSG